MTNQIAVVFCDTLGTQTLDSEQSGYNVRVGGRNPDYSAKKLLRNSFRVLCCLSHHKRSGPSSQSMDEILKCDHSNESY